MPLAFHSTSHGRVAFGFFNIETDLLLLERLLFFADDFCRAVEDLAAAAPGEPAASPLPAHDIRDAAAMGDLHGAIAGTDLSGFIGATYRLFPFPTRPEGFKQSPTGRLPRETALELLREHGREAPTELSWTPRPPQVAIGPFAFAPLDFAELVDYVDRGGYPRWRDEVRPTYVAAMVRGLAEAPGHIPWVPRKLRARSSASR